MTFDLVRISCTKDDRGNVVYRSFIQLGGRAATRVFRDRGQMVEVLRRILATQRREHPRIDDALVNIESGSQQFSSDIALDLTAEQARLLGWM